MGLVVAVINKPKSCASCPFINDGYAFNMCNLSKRQITTVDIPDWCELRPMPKRKHASVSVNNGIHLTGLREWGWNDCLDAIIGDTDESSISD